MPEPSVADALRQRLASDPSIKLALLFGSHARGQARPDSDIDIAILEDAPLGSARRSELISAIAERFECPVDLIDLHEAGEPLLGEILQGQRLVGSNALYAQLLTRHLLDAADFGPLQQRILKERRDRWLT